MSLMLGDRRAYFSVISTMSLPRGIPYFAISYDVPQSIIGWLLSPSALVYGPVTYLRLLNFVATIPITPTRYLSGIHASPSSGSNLIHTLYSISTARNLCLEIFQFIFCIQSRVCEIFCLECRTSFQDRSFSTTSAHLT